MPAGLWVVLCACQAAPEGGAWVQGRHFTAFGRRGGVLRADVKKPCRWGRGLGYLPAAGSGKLALARTPYWPGMSS